MCEAEGLNNHVLYHCACALAADFQTLAALQALAAGQQAAPTPMGAQESAWFAQQQQQQQQQVLLPELAAFTPAQVAQLAQLGQFNQAAVSQSGAILSSNALTQLQLRVRSLIYYSFTPLQYGLAQRGVLYFYIYVHLVLEKLAWPHATFSDLVSNFLGSVFMHMIQTVALIVSKTIAYFFAYRGLIFRKIYIDKMKISLQNMYEYM